MFDYTIVYNIYISYRYTIMNGEQSRKTMLPLVALLLLVSTTIATTPTITLNNGVLLPAIAAGTWQYKPEIAEQSVNDAFEAGFTHIDTAHDYDNQDGVGKALQGRKRDSFFLTTKVPGCGLQGISKANCAQDSSAAIDANLKQLGLDYVDLLLIHFPPLLGCKVESNCKAIQSQYAALEAALTAKKTRAIGVSNFCISCFECLNKTMKVTPAINQVKYHVGMGSDPGGLKSYCSEQGIHMQAYSPLGDNASALIEGPLLEKIGTAHNKSSVQVALSWIWQNAVPVVTKSTKLGHLKDDIDIFDFKFSADELKELNSQTQPSGSPSFMCKS